MLRRKIILRAPRGHIGFQFKLRARTESRWRAHKGSAAGRSIVGGNDRPFTETLIEKEDGSYLFNAKEPGDDPNDGVFFSTAAANADVVAGSWKPDDIKKKTKEYNLLRKKFEYKPDAGSYPQASQRLLKPKDLENEMKEDLETLP